MVVLTWLYVPATSRDLIPKAFVTDADAVIIDLEDSVLAPRKDEARANAVEFVEKMSSARAQVQVRVNSVHTEVGRADLRAIRNLRGLDGVRLPKTETVEDVATAFEFLGGESAPPLHCLLESAEGIENALQIAKADGVQSISIGEADLGAQLGFTAEQAFNWIRTRIVVASAAAGHPPPAMSVFPSIHSDDDLLASCLAGRELGMLGRYAIHPRQLPVIKAAFSPTPAELAEAQKLVDAALGATLDGSGAFVLPNGHFVDEAVVRIAERVLELDAAVNRRS